MSVFRLVSYFDGVSRLQPAACLRASSKTTSARILWMHLSTRPTK